MQPLLRDLRYAARVLARSPGFALVAVLTLALGIGANTAIFSTIHAVLLRPLPYADPHELILLSETQPKFERMSVAYLNWIDYRDRNATFESMGAFRYASMNLTGKGEPERLAVRQFAHTVLPTLGVSPLHGRNFLPEEDAPRGPRAVILSHGFWTRRFAADPDIVDQTITLDGQAWTVVGVMPPEFRFYRPGDIIIPLGAEADARNFQSRGSHPGIYVVGRLKDGVTLEQARADLLAVGDGLAAESPDGYGVTRPRLVDLHTDLSEDYRDGLLLLFGAVICVLLIAAANVANLMLARAMTRQKEMRIRAALGSGRWRLIRQLLVESALIGALGGALGLLLALWGVDLLTAARPEAIDQLGPITIDATVLGYTLLVALATSLLFGLVPAIYASRQDLSQALKDADHHATASGRQLRIRDALIVVEVALALMLLVGAGLAMRSLMHLQSVDTGFKPDNLLTVEVALPTARYKTAAEMRRFWTELERRVAAVPGVVSVASSAGLPFAGASESSFQPLGEVRSVENTRMAVAYFVGPGYIETLGVPLLAGRTFGPQDAADTPPGLIIDQALADKFFPGVDPIGQHLQDGMSEQHTAEVVGVVGHVKHYGLAGPQPAPYQMYYAYPQLPEDAQRQIVPNLTLIARTQVDPHSLAAQVRAAVTAIDPEQPIFAVSTMTEYIDVSLSGRRFTSTLLGVFAGLALVLAAVGLYAIMANAVTQRTHELGVRMALGARPRAVVGLVVRQGMLLVGAGVVLGTLGALGLTRLMTTLLSDEISPNDPATYVGVSMLLVIVGLLATLLPARRAVRIDPMLAMRHE